jgi:tetratricopeptide (TPR) repeat protein
MSQADYQQALKQIETGDLPGALQTLDRIIKKNPKLTEAYYKRAQVRQKVQDFKGAIADYQETMRLQPLALSFQERTAIQSQIITLENAIADTRLLNSAKHLFRFSSRKRALRSIAVNIQQLYQTSI